jgi:hypothetical protein
MDFVSVGKCDPKVCSFKFIETVFPHRPSCFWQTMDEANLLELTAPIPSSVSQRYRLIILGNGGFLKTCLRSVFTLSSCV